MTPTGAISFNDVMVEMGISSGTLEELGYLCGLLNTYSTGASHSADSLSNCQGFSGGNIWHFLTVDSCVDYGTYVRAVIHNNGTVDSQSGTFLWGIYDSSNNLLASGGSGTGSINTSSTSNFDMPYSAGSPDYVKWRWNAGLSWNQIGV